MWNVQSLSLRYVSSTSMCESLQTAIGHSYKIIIGRFCHTTMTHKFKWIHYSPSDHCCMIDPIATPSTHPHLDPKGHRILRLYHQRLAFLGVPGDQVLSMLLIVLPELTLAIYCRPVYFDRLGMGNKGIRGKGIRGCGMDVRCIAWRGIKVCAWPLSHLRPPFPFYPTYPSSTP